MREFFERFLGRRIWPLFLKELRQLKRNRRLVVILIIPPTLNIVLFGFALNPKVTHLRLGVVDEGRTVESRELSSAFTESQTFQIRGYYSSADELGEALSAGELDAGLVIPFDYAKRRVRGETVEVQLLIDAVNSNTAAIAGGYSARIINALNEKLARSAPRRQAPATRTEATPSDAQPASSNPSDRAVTSPVLSNPAPVALDVRAPLTARASVVPRVAILYNPGLQNAWFIVTGMIGLLLVLQGSLVAAASMVREKEIGTIEQLLMTPAESREIIVAKIAPIFLLLTADIALALSVGRLIFGVPVRGSLLLLFFAGALCVLAGIGIGTFIATFTKSQQQAQLMGFFVNPPVALLSGATTPIEAMPKWLQPFTYLNPVRHFAVIARGVMLKGTGLEVLYPNMLALALFAVLLVWVSAWRFRKQLG
jgi:ABC-2 type transport system permease protein